MLVRVKKQSYLENKHGNIYLNGGKYPIELKVRVAHAYMKASNNLSRLANITHLATKMGVSRGYIQSVTDELMVHGYITERTHPSKGTLGCPGRTKLTALDYWFLIYLYREEPSRTLRSYANELESFSGVIVSRQTIYNVLTKAFNYKDKLRTANLIPLDKFRENNILRANEFIGTIRKIPLHRIKTFDEKLLKNSEGLARRVRRDPIT